jgi:uncharacterized membrane-anchored protein
MPYIAPEHRQKLDPFIEELARSLVQEAEVLGYDAAFAGLLNYACTRLALKVARQQFGPLRYWLIALITGIFKNLADEFYRRLGQPYEDRQLACNGDLDEYAEYLKEIRRLGE